MTSLLNISKPRQGDVISLRRFYDHLESYIRSLSALGKNTDSYGSLLVPSLLDKMPAEVQMNLARTHGNREWNLDELRKAILTEVEILETCKTRPIFDISSSTRGTVTSLHTEVRKKSPPAYYTPQRPRRCIYWKGEHSPTSCTHIKDSNERHEFVKKSRLCFNCLGQHTVDNCRSKGRCFHCKKKHHTSIGPLQNTHHADIATPVCKETPAVTGSTPPTPPPQNASLHAQIAPHNKGTHYVYLKTAITTVCDERSAYSTTGHLLFDDGSQRSFITEDLVKGLHIQPIRKELINISGLGGAENAIKNVDIVRLAIDCNDEKIQVELLVTPNITKPIRLQNSEQQGINALCNLRLANPITDNAFFDVSILI